MREFYVYGNGPVVHRKISSEPDILPNRINRQIFEIFHLAAIKHTLFPMKKEQDERANKESRTQLQQIRFLPFDRFPLGVLVSM